jgi:hypothetical protein
VIVVRPGRISSTPIGREDLVELADIIEETRTEVSGAHGGRAGLACSRFPLPPPNSLRLPGPSIRSSDSTTRAPTIVATLGALNDLLVGFTGCSFRLHTAGNRLRRRSGWPMS